MRLACLVVVSTLLGCANANPDDASLAVSPTSLTLDPFGIVTLTFPLPSPWKGWKSA